MSTRRSAFHFAVAAPWFLLLPGHIAVAAAVGDEAQIQWRKDLKDAIVSLGRPGCFAAKFPDPAPLEIPCVQRAPGSAPLASARANAPEAVGAGIDYVAISTTASINTISTTVEAISGVTEEYDTRTNALNTYSLQLNTNRWTGSPACGGIAGCQAWQQFIYDYATLGLYVEYWLINYPYDCKKLGSGWARSRGNCYSDAGGTPVPQIKISALQGAWFEATTDGAPYPLDYLQFNLSDGSAYITTGPSPLGLAGNFRTAEFNIFGTTGSSWAVFNPGSQVTLSLFSGGHLVCSPKPDAGTTDEHNNLSLKSCSVLGLGGPLDVVQIVEGN